MGRKASSNDASVADSEFPYRFLLRYTWPEHIEKALRRLMWSWLSEQAQHPGESDMLSNSEYMATHLFWLIAINPEAPPPVLEVISHTNSEAFVERVAENANAWPTTLSRLATHHSSKVRHAVASNHNTPVESLLDMVKDYSVDVRYVLADNPNRTKELLEMLVDDDNVHVSARAQRSLAQLQKPELLAFPIAKTSEYKARKAAVQA